LSVLDAVVETALDNKGSSTEAHRLLQQVANLRKKSSIGNTNAMQIKDL